MTTATTTTTFKTMTWQAVEKMATEMGVTYYKESNQYRRNGYGIKATAKNRGYNDQTRIEIIFDAPTTQNNDFLNSRIRRMATENFMMKLELWAIKNNVQYIVTESSYRPYIQIVDNK